MTMPLPPGVPMSPLDALLDATMGAWAYLLATPLLLAACVGGVVTMAVARTTLYGVKISLHAASQRSKQELEHASNSAEQNRAHAAAQALAERESSANEKERERVHAMRRTLYGEAISAIKETKRFVKRAWSRRSSVEAFDEIASTNNSINAQMSIIASTNTAIIFSQIAFNYTLVLSEAVNESHKSHVLHEKDEALNAESLKLQLLIENIKTSLIKNSDQAIELKNTEEKLRHLIKNIRLPNFEELRKNYVIYRSKTTPAFDATKELEAKLILSMREDLGVPSDEASLLSLLASLDAQTAAEIKKSDKAESEFLQELKDALEVKLD